MGKSYAILHISFENQLSRGKKSGRSKKFFSKFFQLQKTIQKFKNFHYSKEILNQYDKKDRNPKKRTNF